MLQEAPSTGYSARNKDPCPAATATTSLQSISSTGAGQDGAPSLSPTCLAKQLRCPAEQLLLSGSLPCTPRATSLAAPAACSSRPCCLLRSWSSWSPGGQAELCKASVFPPQPPTGRSLSAPAGCMLGLGKQHQKGAFCKRPPREEGCTRASPPCLLSH